jgi:hypothetical protein
MDRIIRNLQADLSHKKASIALAPVGSFLANTLKREIGEIEQALERLTAPVESKYLNKCNRVEVITREGRVYVSRDCHEVHFQMQDDDRTLKIFHS